MTSFSEVIQSEKPVLVDFFGADIARCKGRARG